MLWILTQVKEHQALKLRASSYKEVKATACTVPTPRREGRYRATKVTVLSHHISRYFFHLSPDIYIRRERERETADWQLWDKDLRHSFSWSHYLQRDSTALINKRPPQGTGHTALDFPAFSEGSKGPHLQRLTAENVLIKVSDSKSSLAMMLGEPDMRTLLNNSYSMVMYIIKRLLLF